ncbi:MAG: ferrous iron transporter B, partial [Clostridia bacterium]|nr:ferrous iron transporter B [Clostridia bacterium]
YHMPLPGNVFRTTWERGWDFIKRAGSVILVASVAIWVLNNLSFSGGFHYITETNGGTSILEVLGKGIAYLFVPLGFGQWQSAVATILGLMAKEEVVGVFGALGMGTAEQAVGQIFNYSNLAGMSFLVFNLLCAPCFAAMGAIRREMNNSKWTAATIGYMCAFAYAISLMTYQFGNLIAYGTFTVWTALAFAVLAFMLFMLFRKNSNKNV